MIYRRDIRVSSERYVSTQIFNLGGILCSKYSVMYELVTVSPTILHLVLMCGTHINWALWRAPVIQAICRGSRYDAGLGVRALVTSLGW